MSHTEAKLKSALFRRLQQDEPTFIILQIATAGAPDREVIGNGFTSRWEGKHGTPRFTSHGNQELMCQRLANQGHCRYIVWIDDAAGAKYTVIVHPLHIRGLLDRTRHQYEALFTGHNHKAVSDYIRKVHRADHDS